MSRRRVVVTGLGPVTPVGIGVDAYWDALVHGRSGISPITLFDTTKFAVHFGGEVKDFAPQRWVDEKVLRRMDRMAQFAMVGAALALEDSGVDLGTMNPDRFGVILGSGIGGLAEMEEQVHNLQSKGPHRISPFFIPKHMMNSAPGHIAIRYGLKGPNFSCASACASANHAMGMALRSIQYGDADAFLTGGTEAALTPSGLGGFCSLRALSRRNDDPQAASRPFDKNRDGFVLSEGACILVFEELEGARRRGANILAEVVGFGSSDDAYHITAPDEDGGGAARAITEALRDAGRSPEDVDYVNAHGTSTELNDRTETRAIHRALGDRARHIPVSAGKSMTGHLLGASAAVEAAGVVLSIRKSVIHPTINYETPDPDCDLDYVPGAAREHRTRLALSNSLGFGGHNSCLALAKYEANG